MALTQVQQGMVGTQTSIPTTYGSIGSGNASIMKNRIINGAMVIDQRNAGAAWGTSISGYCVDRWVCLQSVTGKLNGGQNYNSITPPVGFANYIGVQSQSAYSVGASDYYVFLQAIEGFNTADLGWGTADAKTITLSFQVRSSLTGTFGGSVRNSAGNRSYPFSYTISSANTWTSISVTIAGDTSGTWIGATNGIGMTVNIGMGVGSTYSATAGSWQAGAYLSTTGATSVVGTNGATFYITGVQLEVGSSATGFEYENYTSLLQKCQRYYSKSFNIATAPANNSGTPYTGSTLSIITTTSYTQNFTLPVSMRTAPTVTAYNPLAASAGTWTVYSTAGTPSSVTANILSSYITTANFSGYFVGSFVLAYGEWAASAEL